MNLVDTKKHKKSHYLKTSPYLHIKFTQPSNIKCSPTMIFDDCLIYKNPVLMHKIYYQCAPYLLAHERKTNMTTVVLIVKLQVYFHMQR
jgi:hypothetical protein